MAEENAFELYPVYPAEEVITPESKSETPLLKMIQIEKYDVVHGIITAKRLMTSDNPLSLAIQVAEELHQRANKKQPDKFDFISLASRVEEFTLRFLDPLNYDSENRKNFFNNSETNDLVNTAIKFEQKKFFDHPVIIDFLKDSWYGRRYQNELPRRWWFFLSVCCLFDVFIFPLIFLLTLVVGIQKAYFEIPCFIFARDTISYLVLLALHLALSVESSQLSFSALEWAILVFFAGRLLIETKQINDFRRKPSEHRITGLPLPIAKLNNFKVTYLRDHWNAFDFLIFAVYIFAILPLRIAIWVESESANNNRILAIAGHLYGVNTMLLTFRAFGSILETTKGVGTIQIAFFNIVWDAVVVVLHFLVITMAFSSTITKVFVAEKTMVSKNTPEKQPVCNKSGIQCWWKIAKHLGWSLLDLSEGLSTLESTDSYSETLAKILFAAYLIFTLILLINMLIALLSNTYQRVQDNSRNEWVFKRAIATQTYLNYHPIPVPWNIFSIPAVWIYNLCKRKVEREKTSQSESQVQKGSKKRRNSLC